MNDGDIDAVDVVLIVGGSIKLSFLSHSHTLTDRQNRRRRFVALHFD